MYVWLCSLLQACEWKNSIVLLVMPNSYRFIIMEARYGYYLYLSLKRVWITILTSADKVLYPLLGKIQWGVAWLEIRRVFGLMYTDITFENQNEYQFRNNLITQNKISLRKGMGNCTSRSLNLFRGLICIVLMLLNGIN